MAKQIGPLPITGSIGDLTFYKGQNGYYVRQKSSIDSKRIEKDPSFKDFRNNGKRFGEASQLAKWACRVNRIKNRAIYLDLLKKAYALLRAGVSGFETEAELQSYLQLQGKQGSHQAIDIKAGGLPKAI